MSTQFVSLVSPPGDALKNYEANVAASKQPDKAPAGFIDAMIVRQEVFVDEQHVPLANELDNEDARSWHWVAYASVGAPSKLSTEPLDGLSKTTTEADRKASATQLPIATIRLIPPPHDPYPIPGSSMIFNSTTGAAVWTMRDGSDYQAALDARKKTFRNSKYNEPYIMLGRLATSPPFRGLGLSKLVINTCLDWAAKHPADILPPLKATEREAARLEEDKHVGDEGQWKGFEEGWRGLVLVHAQVTVEKLWAKFGFVKDQDMGSWWEEGMEHIAMWRRLELQVE